VDHIECQQCFTDLVVPSWTFKSGLSGQLEYLEPHSSRNISVHWRPVWSSTHRRLPRLRSDSPTILNRSTILPNINIGVLHPQGRRSLRGVRTDTFQDIVQRISDEPATRLQNAPVHYYLTAIYELLVFEAFSKVIRSLIPSCRPGESDQHPHQQLRVSRRRTCLTFSARSTSRRTRAVECRVQMCSDYIDVIVDISELYSWISGSETKGRADAEARACCAA